MNNIALGQYYPSGSVMHRLDPRMKMIIAIAYIVASFLCKNVISFALLLISALSGLRAPRTNCFYLGDLSRYMSPEFTMRRLLRSE